MECDSCGNKSAHRLRFSESGSSCNACGNSPAATFHDVHFRQEYFDPHIAHHKDAPFGTHIRSRGHKAQLMRQYGISEAGDKHHGSR